MKHEGEAPEPMSEELRNAFSDLTPVTLQSYHKLYHTSIANREAFWKKQADRLIWGTRFSTVMEENFAVSSIAWYPDGEINACANALDAHIGKNGGGDTALVYFGSDGEERTFTFSELEAETSRVSAALTAKGCKTGDRIALYLPDCPETVLFMLACARRGIIYVPVPFYFTAEVTAEIVHDSGATLLVTALSHTSKSFVERARKVIEYVGDITVVVVGNETGGGVLLFDEFLGTNTPDKAPADNYDAEHPLFIIYANSATGIPRGSVFATGGFLVQTATSFETVLPQNGVDSPRKALACTLNLASAGGQSYGFWGPLLDGRCVVITAEGECIGKSMLRRILDRFPSPILLTTPRMLTMLKHDTLDKLPENIRFSRVACSGDVLTPRLVTYAGTELTNGQENVLNLWIQSESGSALINTYPDADINRPGALGVPFYGVKPIAMNTMGNQCRTNESGQLVFAGSWPGMIRNIWGQPDRFQELYFHRIPGYFMTNDAVRIDNEGFFWFMGRLDDVVKVRGQSLATSEIEAVLIVHPAIAEAAVVSVPGDDADDLIAFLSIERESVDVSNDSGMKSLENELSEIIIRRIGEFALPNRFIFARELPRTRTGKLVRRVLRRIATGRFTHDEDLSHIANPHSVEELVKKKDR